MVRVSILLKEGAQKTKLGLEEIVNICYSYTNQRQEDKQYWFNKIDSMFNIKDSKIISGNQMIIPEKVEGEVVSWKVVFPKGISLKKRIKSFRFNKYNGSSGALEAAVKYRDKEIKD